MSSLLYAPFSSVRDNGILIILGLMNCIPFQYSQAILGHQVTHLCNYCVAKWMEILNQELSGEVV